MASVNIPHEGLKIVCIIGFYEGNPIWRQVGKLSISKKTGLPVVMLDNTFSAAGVHRSVQTSGSALLTCSPFSEEELAKKNSYSKKPEPPPPLPKPSWDDDDIPF